MENCENNNLIVSSPPIGVDDDEKAIGMDAEIDMGAKAAQQFNTRYENCHDQNRRCAKKDK